MKSFAVAALVAVAAAQYQVAPPAYNSTSVASSTPAYSVPVYSTPSSSAGYETKTYECSGPTTIPVGPSSTWTYTGTVPTTVTLSYPAAPPPSYPTASANGTVPAPPVGTGYNTPAPSGTGSYTPGTPAPSEFPGAAGKTGLSLLAVAGALVALF